MSTVHKERGREANRRKLKRETSMQMDKHVEAREVDVEGRRERKKQKQNFDTNRTEKQGSKKRFETITDCHHQLS